MRWLDRITNSVGVNLYKLQESVEDRGVWHAAVYRVEKNQAWLSNNNSKLENNVTKLSTQSFVQQASLSSKPSVVYISWIINMAKFNRRWDRCQVLRPPKIWIVNN